MGKTKLFKKNCRPDLQHLKKYDLHRQKKSF